MTNIILADNQDITRLGVRYLLNQIGPMQYHEVDTKKDLIVSLLVDSDCVVILDYTLFDFESVNDLLILESRFEQTKWIVFSEELTDDFINTLLINTKEFSIIEKTDSQDEIQMCLKEVLKGKRFICSHASNLLLERSRVERVVKSKHVLTATEEEILKEMALGKTTKEIATQRFVSVHTIMTHRKNIFRKIDVNNIHEATKYAIKAGIIDLTEYYI